MTQGNSRLRFLETQRAVLRAEIEQSQQRLAQAEQAIQAAYPKACEAAKALQPEMVAGLEQARKQALETAGKGTWGPALGLVALTGNSAKALLLLWGSLVALWFLKDAILNQLGYLMLSGVLMLPFYLLIKLPWAVTAYAGLVWLGRKRLIKARSAQTLASINALPSKQMQLFAFGKRFEDKRSHPYPVVRAPAPSMEEIHQNWGLEEAHNNSLAVAVGFTNDVAADPNCMLRLALNNHPPGLMFVQKQFNTHLAVWRPLFEALGTRLAPLAQPIVQLKSASEPYAQELVTLQSLETQLASLDRIEQNWQDVAIPGDTLEQIVKLVDRFAAGTPPLPKGMLLWGPPGTGKTLIARKLAEHVRCNFVAVSIADLKAQHIGQTAPRVKEVWNKARAKGPTILFVDECESAFASRGSRDSDSFSNELVQTFISEWDGFNQGGGNVLVIGATNRRELIDEAVMSRFTTSIELPAPNAEARQAILQAEFTKANIALPVTDALVRETTGMSGRDLSTLVTRVVSTHPAGRPVLEDFVAAIGQLRGKSSTAVQSLTWDDIILPAATRREFESLGKELVHAEELAKMNIPTPRGILLYGPPGTGKTQIARVLASQSGLSFIAASSTDVKGQYLGDGAAKVKQLFEKARAQAPCIVFLDEIDTIAPPRGSENSDKLNTEIVAQLLQELDGVTTKKGQVFLLAASNHPDAIDSALLSRLERKIEIGLPDATARAAILRLQLAGKPLDEGVTVEQLVQLAAERSEGMSGRDLQSLVTAATRAALQRAMVEHGDPTKLLLRPIDVLEQVGEASASIA